MIDSDRSGGVSWSHIFSPSLFNEFLASGRYRIGGGYSGTSTTVDADWFGQLGMPNPFGVQGLAELSLLRAWVWATTG